MPKKGIEQEPNEPYRYYFLSLAQRDANHFEDAIPPIETALQLARFSPVNLLNQLAWVSSLEINNSKRLTTGFDEILDRDEKSVYGFLAYLGLPLHVNSLATMRGRPRQQKM